LAPTHEARVTARGYANDKQLTAAHGRLFRRLRKHRCEYLGVNEWGESGQRHLHIILRAEASITAEQVSQWWEESLPAGVKGTSHCEPIRSVPAFVRYVFKDIQAGGMLPPEDFKGKLYTASRGFLVRPLAALWKEERDSWDRSEGSKESVETPCCFGGVRWRRLLAWRSETAGRGAARRFEASRERTIIRGVHRLMTTELERDTFEMPQSAAYFDADKLRVMTGQPAHRFCEVCIKELIDNGLDAAEKRGVRPEVSLGIVVKDESFRIIISDNGGGMPSDTVDSLLNFQTRTSDKVGYRSLTRGAQGNGLKTVLGILYALGRKEPVVLEAQGVRHILRPHIDPAGEASVHHGRRNVQDRPGTRVSLVLPIDDLKAAKPAWWAQAFALFNPHVLIRISKTGAPSELADTDASRASKKGKTYQPTVAFPAAWRKFLPTDATSPWWYFHDDLARLIFLKIGKAKRSGVRSMTLRDFVREFRGLSDVRKAKAVCDQFPDISRLEDFEGRESEIPNLLKAMWHQTQAPSAAILGAVGEEHLRSSLDQRYGVKRWWYKRKSGEADGGVCFVVEAAIAEVERGEGCFYGINFSPTYEDPLASTDLSVEDVSATGVRSFLERCHVFRRPNGSGPRTVAILHLAFPSPDFKDTGKTRLEAPDEVAEAAAAVLWKVGKELYVEGERRRKDAARQEAADDKRSRKRNPSDKFLKDAVDLVIQEAVSKASGGGVYQVSAHTLFYHVRPLCQHHTTAVLASDYFEQTLLPAYQRRQAGGMILLPDGRPAIYYEPRGILYEPHTGKELPLGTREVESYEFPAWRYDKIFFVEKKGLWPILKAARLAERYDMAIIAGEGYAAEACRTLFANAEATRTFQMFSLHDADPFGYNIARTLREETQRMQGYQANVVDLGLTLEDALQRGLPLENFTRRQALPSGLILNDLERQHFEGRQISFGKKPSWVCQRVELNAFSAPDLIEYAESKMAAHGVRGKLVPPPAVLAGDLEAAVKERLQFQITEDILRKADVNGTVEVAFQAIRPVIDGHREGLEGIVAQALKAAPEKLWRAPVADIAVEIVAGLNGRAGRSGKE
jgi:DNA topoisomerase VI subunit B